MKRAIILAVLTQITLLPLQSTAQNGLPEVTFKEVMERVITPATNTLWGANDPQTDEEWQVLEDAAITMIAIGTVIDTGGAGPADNAWAEDPVWKAFNQSMTAAAVQARQAIQDRNMDALLQAGDALYTPCETCHLQFSPTVIEQ